MQEISDSVADVEWEEETVGNAIAACAAQTAELAAKINTDRARRRYLENLVDKDNVADDDSLIGMCYQIVDSSRSLSIAL